MVYAPQRRHAVASLTTTIQAIALLQHLYTPNLLILITRLLGQIQMTAPAFIQPNRSLFGLFSMMTIMNMVAVLLHMLDFASGMNGGKGIILDFVGQAYPASKTRILLLDFLLYILQATSLFVSYLSTHVSTISFEDTFDFDDLLLPPSGESVMTDSPLSDTHDDADDLLDLEAGGLGPRRRRAGSRAFDGAEEESGVWLDDERDPSSSRTPLLKSPTTRSARPRRPPDPPLIFSLPFSHMLRLVAFLPPPTPAPRAFSGGTPSRTPPQQTSPLRSSPPVASAPIAGSAVASAPSIVSATSVEEEAEWDHEGEEDDEGQEDVLAGGGYGRRTLVSGRGGRRSDSIGRIPGEYRPSV